MQITETSAEGLTRKYQVTVGADDIERRIASRLSELAKSVNLPGFRPGKVPVSLIRQRFGKSVLGEVLEETVNQSSADTLKEQNLRPALQPKIEISSFDEGKDLVYDMQVEVLPDIEAPDVTTLSLERLKPEIPDDEIDQAIERLAERYRSAEPVTDGSPAANDDVVTIDYVGSIDGTEFDGGSAKDQQIQLGSGRLIPGFEDQLVGAKVGDRVTVKVTFPADYGSEQLAGKDAVFEVDVKELKRKGPIAIDESLAERLGMDNLEELRSAIRDQMTREYEGMGRQKLKRDLLDQLAEKYQFEVPPGMVEIEFGSIWKQFEDERERSKQAGTYKPEEAEDDEKTKAEYRSIAERRVRLGLLLAEVGRRANIQVSQDELNRAVAAQARQFPGQEKAVLDYYRNHPEAAQALRAPIYEDKVVDHIFETAQVTDKVLPSKEFVRATQMDDDEEPAEAAADLPEGS